VALKRWPEGDLLGISCDPDNRFELYVIDDAEEAERAFAECVERMRATGRPFIPDSSTTL